MPKSRGWLARPALTRASVAVVPLLRRWSAQRLVSVSVSGGPGQADWGGLFGGQQGEVIAAHQPQVAQAQQVQVVLGIGGDQGGNSSGDRHVGDGGGGH